MKNIQVSDNITLKSVLNKKTNMVDYYITINCNESFYAFTRKYTTGTYELCKSGIRLNDLRYRRSKDSGIMQLVNYTNRMIPYLAEFYDLQVA